MKKGKKRTPKRVHPFEEGSILVGSDSSAEDTSGLSPIEETSLAADCVDQRRAASPQESVALSRSDGMVLLSDVAWLREELETSRAEVVCLQSLIRGDDTRSLVATNITEFLDSLLKGLYIWPPLGRVSGVDPARVACVVLTRYLWHESRLCWKGSAMAAGPAIFNMRVAYASRFPGAGLGVAYAGRLLDVGLGVANGGWTHCLWHEGCLCWQGSPLAAGPTVFSTTVVYAGRFPDVVPGNTIVVTRYGHSQFEAIFLGEFKADAFAFR
ncbi:hypothetical protein ACLOJK_034199 [Asimina triloba]